MNRAVRYAALALMASVLPGCSTIMESYEALSKPVDYQEYMARVTQENNATFAAIQDKRVVESWYPPEKLGLTQADLGFFDDSAATYLVKSGMENPELATKSLIDRYLKTAASRGSIVKRYKQTMHGKFNYLFYMDQYKRSDVQELLDQQTQYDMRVGDLYVEYSPDGKMLSAVMRRGSYAMSGFSYTKNLKMVEVIVIHGRYIKMMENHFRNSELLDHEVGGALSGSAR